MSNSETKPDGQAIAISHPAVTNDGVVTTHFDVFATSPEVGSDFAARVEAESGHMTHEPLIGDLDIREDGASFIPFDSGSVRNRSSKSFSGAFESRDPNASKWQPSGPKEPGKRLN